VGHGHELGKFAQVGIPQASLIGVDLVLPRLLRTKHLYPAISISQQDAANLAFGDEIFDIVCQFTCVMHALSRELQVAICKEMARVLKPGGIIVWWDIAIPLRWPSLLFERFCDLLRNPSFKKLLRYVKESTYETISAVRRREVCNKDVAFFMLPIPRQHIIEMFPHMNVSAKNAGLDYAVWRILWPLNRTVANVLWRSGWLSQHCFAVIEKPLHDSSKPFSAILRKDRRQITTVNVDQPLHGYPPHC
jgi:SAM-dependent methyltransferase